MGTGSLDGLGGPLVLASSRGEPKCQPKKTFLSAIKDGSDEEESQAP
jgi:hypothetical protein